MLGDTVNKTPNSLPEENSDGIDFGYYLQVIRRRAWVIASALVLGVTLAIVFTLAKTKVYEATASIVIDPRPPQVFGSEIQEVVQLGTGTYWANKEYYNTQVEIVAGYDLVKLTVTNNQLHQNPSILPNTTDSTETEEERIERATSIIHSSLLVTRKRDSRIVSISVRHTDQVLATVLANMHVETYTDFMRGLRTSGTGKASKFLAEELDAAEARLKESEKRLYEFSKNNEILSVSLEDKQNILAKNIARFTAALGDARIKRVELGALRNRAKNWKGKDVFESPVFSLASNLSSVETAKEQYVREKHRLVELGEELGPRHPMYKSQKQKVDGLHATIKKEMRRAISELNERYKAALEAEKRFKEEVEKFKKEAFALGPKAIEYNRYKRQQLNDEESYKMVLGRLRTSELSGRNRAVNVRPQAIAREATLVSPILIKNLAIAVFLSLITGLGFAFLLNYLDRTIKTAKDVEDSVNAPLLGIIPVVESAATETDSRDRDLWVHKNPSSSAAECCRSIRTNILFSAADKPMKTLAISSPKSQDGKTTSTIYLGTTMAQNESKVLIVDTDLRRPRLHKALGVSSKRGITNLILGNCTLEDAVQTTAIPNLYVLPCGPLPPNPAELLLTDRFRDILEELETKFDRVLLDTPPLLAVTDGVVLARLSDGVILVAQAGKTTGDDVTHCARLVNDVRAPILGLILNNIDLSDKRYGYQYYQYQYGDGQEAVPVSQSI